jgi:5,10-methylenetetrahydrofolate reductase
MPPDPHGKGSNLYASKLAKLIISNAKLYIFAPIALYPEP